MTYELETRSKGTAQGSFHALRMARRISHRTARGPVKRRSRQSEVREHRVRILILLAMALGAEIVAAALTSPLLGIDRITVRGAEQLPEQELALTRHAVALPAGSNLLRAPIDSLERRLKTLPWVQSADVRRLPPHSLSVRFAQRVHAVAVRFSGQEVEIDETGVPIRLAPPEPVIRLPQVEMEGETSVRLGVPLHDDALLAAIRIYRDAPRQPMVHIAKIKIDPAGNMCLNMLDGIQVELGRPDDIEAKMRYLLRVYELDPNVGSRMVAINLSVPKQPACTLKSDVPAEPASSRLEPTAPDDHSPDSGMAM